MTIDKQFKIWEGVYESFTHANGDQKVFQGEHWLEKVTERARKSIVIASEKSSISPIAGVYDYPLPVVAAMAARQGKLLRILDFGGGLGASYLPLVKMLPAEQPLEFLIIDNQAICRQGNNLFTNDCRVRFQTELPVPGDKYNIVHCGSSIHYVEKWEEMLHRFAGLNPEYIIFSDLPAADNKTFVTVQNYYGRRIPAHFWNLQEFVSIVVTRGYKLVFKARYRGYFDKYEDIPTGHFEPEYRLSFFSHLIFRRSVSNEDLGQDRSE